MFINNLFTSSDVNVLVLISMKAGKWPHHKSPKQEEKSHIAWDIWGSFLLTLWITDGVTGNI